MALGRLQSAIVENLVGLGRLTPAQQQAIVSTPKELNGDALEQLLRDEYNIQAHHLLIAKARAFGMTPLNVNRVRVHKGTFEKISMEFCQQKLVLPVGSIGEYVLVAFANPFELTVSSQIQDLTGKRVVPFLAREKDIRDKLSAGAIRNDEQFHDVVKAVGAEYEEKDVDLDATDAESEESAPIIQLANRIIEDAFAVGTSDIHIEPSETEVTVRYRVDGNCQVKLKLPSRVGPALVARLKIMSNLDISERRLPQDGRIVFKQFTKKNIDIDLRVSTAPLNWGEGVVMRILDKQKSTLPLPALGFSQENLGRYREVIRQPYGMILHCGPTGSGKSMTLYSALNEINSPDIVIRTAEDPIEYTLAGINQMQMHRQIGLTFASALRAFLRQDPDIILVGEIRDKETANIAVEAALTGHLLLSTLHTNDAPSTIARLTDMGIEPFMISSSLLCVCAQRLMRRVCKVCRKAYEPEGREKEILEKSLGWQGGQIYKANAKGCSRCNNTGYKGRVGIHELMTISDELIEAINKGKEAAEIKKIAMRNGMKTLHQDSMLKVVEGLSTMEESLCTVPPDL
ncbi:MAG: Flp pilus assembly complex ATPase component TadA [Opitutaceae bacterium]|nr:Flp pilus assembly complex ATPase component TadA [Opitutaceae bacterium]